MLSALYRSIMFVGHAVCHQLPDRSPHLFGVQLPLCWRCTGIVVGTICFLGYLFYSKRLFGFRLSLALALLMPIDVFTAMAGLRPGVNAWRFITGILWGLFGTSLTLHIAAYLVRRVERRQGNDPAAVIHEVTYADG
ncbi:MAG: DUF2085 domain-containing protein [Pyrinomonadaceae bacterium]